MSVDLGSGDRWNTPAFQALALAQSVGKLGYPVTLLDLNESPSALRQWKGALVLLVADTCGPEAAVPARWKQPHGFRIGLEQTGVSFLGSPFSAVRRSATGSKHRCRCVLKQAGLAIPPGLLIRRDSMRSAPDLFRRIASPSRHALVVKASEGSGGGVGVHFVDAADALEEVLRWHRDVRKGSAVVERFVEGREFTVWVRQRNGRAEVYGWMEFRKPADQPLLDQGAKIRLRRVRQFSGTVKAAAQVVFQPELPASLERELGQAALCAFAACGLRDYARIDLIAGEDDVFVLDVNAHPDLGPTWLGETAKARGERHEDVLGELIREALARS